MSDRERSPVQSFLEREVPFASSEPIESQFVLSLHDLVVLFILDSEPTTGYVLRKKLSEQFRLRSSFGTLYPRLKSFEKDGVITQVGRESSVRGSGVSYELTPVGKKLLSENLRVFNGFLQKIKEGDCQLICARKEN